MKTEIPTVEELREKDVRVHCAFTWLEEIEKIPSIRDAFVRFGLPVDDAERTKAKNFLAVAFANVLGIFHEDIAKKELAERFEMEATLNQLVALIGKHDGSAQDLYDWIVERQGKQRVSRGTAMAMKRKRGRR